MERKGIIAVGNWIVDNVKFIERYPRKGNLATIVRQEEGLGGCAHNVLADLAAMQSGIPLYAGGCIGDDIFGKMCMDACDRLGIDRSNLKVLENTATSYTDVMSELGSDGTRTFFHCRGANAKLTVEQVVACQSPARIFHLGYLLLLDALDREDPQYGVAAARALHTLLQQGYETSVDMVSEEGERYRKVVLPCLKYTDYLIINEVEAENCLGTPLRINGAPSVPAIKEAATALLNLGVRKLVVIHFPEGGVAASRSGELCYAPSFPVERSEIVSTVGAGDAFCAGVLYAVHEDWPLEKMLNFASAGARFNLFSATSTSGAPKLETILSFLKSRNV